VSAADGYVVGATKIVDHGPDSLRWNLVIVGDGYRAGELTQYHTDVQNFVTRFRNTPPFDTLFCGINIYRIDVVSTDRGADEPAACGGPGTTPRTYFDATFCSVGPGGVRIKRLLTVDQTLALSVATTHVPLRTQVLAIVNSGEYGGSGGVVATCSTEASSAEIGIHEIGHSAFRLADEYGGNGVGTPAGEPVQPNVTRNTNRATNKWRTLIAATTPMPSACDGACAASTCVPPPMPPAAGAVGTYEGGIYSDCNTYRPLPSCYMRDYGPFCPVCSGVIRQTLAPYQPMETIAPRTPSIDFRNVPAGMGGVGVTTHRAIVFEVVTCRRLRFRMTAPPTGGFGTPSGLLVQVEEDPILPATFARLWLSYTSTNPGDTASGSVTVECMETSQTWTINITANTIARPRSAVVLVLDRSGSMNDDAGDAVTKVQKLREAANAFVNILQPADGIGIVRFNEAADRMMDVQVAGAAPGGAGRTAALGHIAGSGIDPGGATSIGDGVVQGKLTLDAGQAMAVPPYDVTAMVILTDGLWNRPPALSAVLGSITANTYAIGLGLPSNISVPALTTLCQGTNGFLLITGAISPDQSMRLGKYFLQVLAGVTNAQIAVDPPGLLVPGAKHRIPFWINEADFGMDVIVLSPVPSFIDFELEAPDGTRITPASAPAGANAQFVASPFASYYRCALPVLPASPDRSHEGLWHAVLEAGRELDPHQQFTAAGNVKSGIPYELVVHTYSSLTFNARVSQATYEVGAVVRLSGTLLEYEAPARGRVFAEIQRPDGGMDVIPFSEEHDGLHVATYELRLAGVFPIRIRARGETRNGLPFERERTLTAVAVEGRDPWGRDDSGKPVNCDGSHDSTGCIDTLEKR
jgi:IgA Peptidase M64/von Willebrand factor type A domain